MNAPRLRAIPAAEPCLRVAPGATLQASAGKEPSILVLGNGQSVPLNPLASAALSLCDGTRNAGEIAASVPQGAARENVMEFLAAAVSLGWIMSDTSTR